MHIFPQSVHTLVQPHTHNPPTHIQTFTRSAHIPGQSHNPTLPLKHTFRYSRSLSTPPVSLTHQHSHTHIQIFTQSDHTSGQSHTPNPPTHSDIHAVCPHPRSVSHPEPSHTHIQIFTQSVHNPVSLTPQHSHTHIQIFTQSVHTSGQYHNPNPPHKIIWICVEKIKALFKIFSE
jgi:hypothetical protein